MEIDLAVLADSVNESKEGKLNILGIFDTLFAASVPCRHPQMTLALRLRADAGEKGSSHQIQIRFVDEDGRTLFQLPEITLSIASETPVLNPVSHLIVNLAELDFQKYGAYRFDISINGRSAREITLPVQKPPFA